MKSYKMTFLCIIFSSIFGLLSKMSLTSPKLSSFIGLFQFLMLVTIMSIVVSVYNTIKKIFDLTEQNIKIDTIMKNQELRKKQETELKVMKDNAAPHNSIVTVVIKTLLISLKTSFAESRFMPSLITLSSRKSICPLMASTTPAPITVTPSPPV